MIKPVLFLSILILNLSLYSQNTNYRGKVSDAEFNTPVPYAAIYLQGTNYGTIANNIGEFHLTIPDTLSEGHLVIIKEEYIPHYFPIDISTDQNDINIALYPDDFEEKTKMILDSLSNNQGGFSDFINKATEFVVNDWIPLGNPNTNKFDFGRIQTFPTYNPIEGVRLRAGFASNSRLNPNLFIKGYGAYGFEDQKFKYRGEITYSFDKKAYHEDEFPKNNINLIYENDLYSPGEMHPRSPNNLLLITYRRSENASTYRNLGEINWDREHQNGFAYTTWLRRSRMIAQGDLEFYHNINDLILDDNALYTTEVGLQLRYSVREAYIQQKRKRRPIETTSPVFFLSHSLGVAEFLGKESRYHRSEFSAQKRFMFETTGRLDVVGEVSKVWNSVPFPLLVYPNQRYRHHIENNAFFLNRALEFMADEQATLRATFVGDDFLLAKIPILNALQFSELISLRASYGRLSDKNSPEYEELYNFPADSYKYDSMPYIEGTIGITNILGLLRVEYVHRFTYRDHPDALLGRIRVDVTL